MPDPSPRDLRHSLVTLGRELTDLCGIRHVMPQERLRVRTDRMASIIVASGAPAALSVAEAVKREPGRFNHGRRGGAQPDCLAGLEAGNEGFDRTVRVRLPGRGFVAE